MAHLPALAPLPLKQRHITPGHILTGGPTFEVGPTAPAAPAPQSARRPTAAAKRASVKLSLTDSPSATGEEDIGRAVVDAEETWKMDTDAPYFDPRVVVDACAHYVASSYLLASKKTEDLVQKRFVPQEEQQDGEQQPPAEDSPVSSPTSSSPRGKGKAKRAKSLQFGGADGEGDGQDGDESSPAVTHQKKIVPVLQALTAHAHSYSGAERLVMELVPRCKGLREQLLQTAVPLCNEASEGAVVSEIDKLLRSRLVVCDLENVMLFDCFSEVEDDNRARKRASVLRLSQKQGRDWRKAVLEQLSSFKDPARMGSGAIDFPAADRADSEERDLEIVVQRFEFRFWRTLARGLGASIFGEQRSDLIARFEAASTEIYTRYQGELQLAVNSLFAWLPHVISDSIFFAFVGLSASTAVRQPWEKYVMLNRCLKALITTSGRYIYLSSPGWYVPLVNWLPSIGQKDILRSKVADLGLSLRPIWPALCFDPHKCVDEVHNIWGGRIPGKRADLQLLPGVESLGRWVLRMTLGCERLLSLAVKEIQSCWKDLEALYDEYAEDFVEHLQGQIIRAERANTAVTSDGEDYEEPFDIQDHRVPVPLLRSIAIDLVEIFITSQKRRRRRGNNAGKRNSSMAGMWHARMSPRASVRQPISPRSFHRMSSMTVGSCWDDEDDILAQLHAATRVGKPKQATTSGDDGSFRLRMCVFTGLSTGMPIEWPLGNRKALGGRIPIHDSPDLVPTAPLPMLERPHDDLSEHIAAPESDGDGQSESGSEASASFGPITAEKISEEPRPQVDTARFAFHKMNTMPDRVEAPPAPQKVKLPPLYVMGDKGDRKDDGERKSKRFQTAPHLTSVPSFSTALGRMLRVEEEDEEDDELGIFQTSANGQPQDEVALTAKELELQKRPSTAPAAIDSSDFDHGDPVKNSIVALALQELTRKGLLGTCQTDGPFRAAWRPASSSEQARDLLRSQLSLSIFVMFAAWRAPLPALQKLPLHYFVCMSNRYLHLNRELFALPKVLLADGIYSTGCTPVFHCSGSDGSARSAPFVADSFHIGVPQVFVEGGTLLTSLTSRVRTEGGLSSSRSWRAGSMLALLTTGSLSESYWVNDDWFLPKGWMRQDHLSLFPALCSFQILCGLELVAIWHKRLPTACDVTLEQFFPFLQGCVSLCRKLSVKMSTDEHDAPVVVAPYVRASLEGNPDFEVSGPAPWKDSERYPGPLSEPVPLQHFAKWVGGLLPGRVVTVSPRSRCGTLYLRLLGAVVIFAFPYQYDPLRAQDVCTMYKDAVGEPEWWGVGLVTYIVFANKLSSGLQFLDGNGHVACLQEGDALTPAEQVKPGSEIIICMPHCLDSILGITKEAAHQHQLDCKDKLDRQNRSEADFRSGRVPSASKVWRGSSVGSKSTPARFRSARRSLLQSEKPKASQLETNFNLLSCLLQHVDQQSKKICATCDAIQGLEQESAAKGEQSWLKAQEAMYRATDEEVDATGEATLLRMESSSSLSVEDAPERPTTQSDVANPKAAIQTQRKDHSPGKAQAVARVPRFDRVPSPQRSDKRRSWRPWTPYPRSTRTNTRGNGLGRVIAEPTYPFDFLNLGKWKDKAIQLRSKRCPQK